MADCDFNFNQPPSLILVSVWAMFLGNSVSRDTPLKLASIIIASGLHIIPFHYSSSVFTT